MNPAPRHPLKKIAIVSDSAYPFNKGGKEKLMHDIAKRLVTEGYEVTIYCMHWWQGPRILSRDGITFHAISPYYPLYAGHRRSISEAAFFALHALKMLSMDFDVVNVDAIPHLVMFSMKFVCLLRRKRLIVTWHEVWGRDYWRTYLGGIGGEIAAVIEKIAARLPDTIICVSEQTKECLRPLAGNRKNIVVVTPGLDAVRISAIAPAAEGADLVFAGRLLPNKNVDMTLRAMQILLQRRPETTACIIGQGPERRHLEQLAKDLNIEKQVVFRDFFEDHDELYSFLHASKLFIFPSTREGFGIVALEANACGLPVITVQHKDNATQKLITEDKNGSVVALKPEALAEVVEQWLQKPEARESYYAYAAPYDWDNLMPKLVSVYQENYI